MPPCCSHLFTFWILTWLLNMWGTLRKLPLLAWGFCVPLYLWNTVYYVGIIFVFGMLDGLCRIHISMIVNAIHYPWDLFISNKILTSWWCNFWLNLSIDASLLEVSLGFFYSCLIATDSYMFGTVLLPFSHFHFA